MAENKTQRTAANVDEFLSAVPDERKRADAYRLLEIMRQETGEEPYMYGSTIVGFGSYHYRYDSGREGDSPLTAFSPRKASLTLYLTPDFEGVDALMARLGKYTTGKVCLYIKRLSDVDETVLRQLIRESVAYVRETNPGRVQGSLSAPA